MTVSRRTFLKASGGLTFAFAIPFASEALANTAALQPNAWVRIAPDGAVTIFSAGAEMGQGSMTSLPLIVAEEMDADWSKVKIEWAPADPERYGYMIRGRKEMTIAGSRAVMSYYDDLRIAGAQVRKVLLSNAAEKWGVSPASLRTEPGAVIDPASGRRMSYGEIAHSRKCPLRCLQSKTRN
jgi:isoquinoline 1-oxidoreductase beta subunit